MDPIDSLTDVYGAHMLTEVIAFMISQHLPPDTVTSIALQLEEFFQGLCTSTLLTRADLVEYIVNSWNLCQ